MAIANADGSIVLTTKVDTSGVKKGMDEATKFAQLNTNEQRRLAQSLSAVYRKQGLTQSEAQKKAWKGLKEGTVTAEEYKKAIEGITLQTEKATKSTKKYGEQAKKSGGTAKNAFASIGSSLKKMAAMALAAFSIQKIIQFNSEASNLATTTEASVQRLIDIYGEASEVVGEFIDLNAQALGMSRAAASSYASVYGNLFSVWADQATNAKLTNNYLNMTAVVASKTGRTVEDVQERIRSGLLGNTEAIEDLGIFVNVKTIEMTDAFQKMASGKSWEQLDAYTQQQIRTLAILEQATQKYGTEVAQTTALTKSQFKAAWQDFQATWGEVINQVLVPVLMVLTDILVVSTEVMSSLFGMASATISQGDAVDEVIDKQEELTQSVLDTEKATQKSFAGFDDVQILPEKSSSDETQAPQIDLPIFDISKTKKEASDFEKNLRKIIGKISSYFSKLKEAVASIWESEEIQTFWDTVQSISELGLDGVETYINTFKENLQLVWDTVEDDFNTIINNLSDLWTNFWSDAKSTIDTYGQDVIDGANGVFSSIYSDVVLFYCDLISKEWADLTTILKDEWELSGEELLDNMGQFFVNVVELLQNVYDNVISPIIAPIFETISKLWDENISIMIEKLVHFITTLANGALEIYNKFIHPIISWIMEKLKPIFDDIGNYISSILYTVGSTISDVLGGIFDALSGLIDFITGVFTGDWEKAWEGIKTFFGGIWDAIWGVIKGIINSIIDGINALWEGLYTTLRSVINGVGGVVEGIGDLMGKDWGWEIPENPPKIPALAQGTVVPPNKEFMAILGDNTKEHEIVSPVSTMKQAFMEAMIEMGGNFGSGNTEVVLEIDGREFGRAVVEQGNRENRRIGTRLVIA